jgi:HSP20 family protein
MRSDLIRMMHALFVPAAAAESAWRPSADVYRTPAGWLLKFDLAGVRPEDVTVTARDRTLTVCGTRRDWCVEEGCTHYKMEISYSVFERAVELPCDLSRARVSAEHRHGMLLVRVTLQEDDA